MKFLLLMLAFGLLPDGLSAQGISGDWQGSIKAGPATTVRMVFRITGVDDAGLKATLFNVDTPGANITASAASFKESTLKLTFRSAGMSYEGNLNAGGDSLTGSLTSAAGSAPLNLARATPQTAWAIPEAPPPVPAMAAGVSPAFEVAAIKPSNPAVQSKFITMRGRQVVVVNNTVSELIAFAYGIHPHQIQGAPAWLTAEHFDIDGQPDAKGQPSLAQIEVMLQKLLADRFQLRFHRDQKELAVYTLTIGKNGHKLMPSSADPNAPPRLAFAKLGLLPAGNASMDELVNQLQAVVLDKPVLNRTGLTGRWDFTLRWTPDATQFIGFGGGTALPPDPDGPPDLFTAIQQQLGLKLESTKAATGVFVIDSVAKPSAN